jgi:hypothetical protein
MQMQYWLTTFVRAAVLSVSLGLPLAGVASAQTADRPNTDANRAQETRQETRPDRPFDWGWLGLIGLTGLLGLLPRKERATRHARADTAGHPVARP